MCCMNDVHDFKLHLKSNKMSKLHYLKVSAFFECLTQKRFRPVSIIFSCKFYKEQMFGSNTKSHISENFPPSITVKLTNLKIFEQKLKNHLFRKVSISNSNYFI